MYQQYPYFYILLYPLLALLISVIITKKLITTLPKLGFIDEPKEGHIHEKPIPTCGGIAIVFSFLVSSLIFIFCHIDIITPYIKAKLPGIYITFFTLIIIGIIDDKFELRYKIKLLFQILVASMCYFFDIKLSTILGYSLNPVLSYILTVLWMFFFMNGFNLVDGLDGLAAGLGAISSFCMGFIFMINGNIAEGIIAFTLTGSSLGFLRYNYHPAKIFMGDTGSMSLGFIIGVSGILFSSKSATLTSVLVPMAASGIPWFDGFLALWRRLSKKILLKVSKNGNNQKMLDRDTDHLHHRILKKTKNQKKASMVLYIISIASAIMAVLLTSKNGSVRSLAFIILLLLTITCIRKLAYWELWNSSQILLTGLKKPGKRVIPIIIEPLIDYILVATAFLISYLLLSDAVLHVDTFYFIKRLIIYSFPIILLLNISRVYRTFWVRASSDDYLYLIEIIILGTFISFIICLFLNEINNFNLILSFFILFCSFIIQLILGERLFLRYMKYSFTKKAFFAVHHSDSSLKVILYGASINCKFYLYNRFKNINSIPEHIIGIMEDAEYLNKQYIYGHKILGNISDINKIHQQYKLDKVVITSSEITEENLEKLKNYCKEKAIELSKCIYNEEVIELK